MKKSNVLVSGSEGFIGSHLVEKLVEEGFSVRAFVLYNSFNSWGWLESLDKSLLDEIDIYTGDVRDHSSVKKACEGVETVFHLAALIAVPYSYEAPESYVDTNINGTLNILNACRELGTKRILITSTSEVYGTAKFVPITESHPKQGQSLYSATKIGADALTESYYKSFNLPVTIVRPFNTFGPRQSARAIIPTIITQLLSGYKEIKLGALSPTRDLLFVKDTVDAFLRIAETEKLIGEEVNIATQTEISVEDLAKKIIGKINASAKIITDQSRLRPPKSEVERLLGSREKLTLTTGWNPKFSLDSGLDATIEWFKNPEILTKYKPNIYNV